MKEYPGKQTERGREGERERKRETETQREGIRESRQLYYILVVVEVHKCVQRIDLVHIKKPSIDHNISLILYEQDHNCDWLI